MAELPQLSKDEWNAMMAMVLDVSIDPTERWNEVKAPGNQDGPHLSEIPDAHPAEGGPKTPDGETDDEIPAGGGFDTKPAATPETGPVMKEIPSDGPASSDSPADKPNKVDDGKMATKVGKPEPTGKPSGSFAKLNDLQYDGTAWTAKGPLSPSGTGSVKWNSTPQGDSLGDGPDAPGQYKKVSQDDPAKFPRKSNTDATPKAANADEDLDKDLPDNLALPDGSFFTQNVDDLRVNVDKVKNADQTNPRAVTHPRYMDVKRHLANRAADLGATHMIPADWQLSMGELAMLEMGRDIDAATRTEYAKKGWALPDKSYPIGNAGDLKNAMILARSNHGNVTAAKALIRRRAKDLGVQLPPDMK